MDAPLLWNTLDEAADWLSNATGTKWNPKRVIDFSIQQYRDRNKEKKDNYLYSFKDGKRARKAGTLLFTKESLAITLLPPSETYLSVKFSKPEAVGWYRCRGDVKDPMPASYTPIVGGLVRVFSSNIDFASLYPKHLKSICLYGKTAIDQPCIEFMPKLGWEYALFDPIKSLTPEEIESVERYSLACHGYLPHDAIAKLGGSCHVTVDMVGVHKENLVKMLREFQEMDKPVVNTISTNQENSSLVDKVDCQDTSNDCFSESECSLFDPLTQAQIKIMFPLAFGNEKKKEGENGNKRKNPFDKAKRNGLDSARHGVRPYKYNPAKVANWLCQKAVYQQNVLAKILSRNLPPRSREHRDSFLEYRGLLDEN